MKHKRRLLSEVLFRTGTLHALKRVLRDRVVVLNYHRIRPDDEGFSTPFDDGVYEPTVSQFDAQMRWLKQHLRVLTEAELIDGLRAGRGPGEMCVLITIDDGYRDSFTRAYPVLRNHRVPAIFFVPSALIELRRVGWWDRLAYILKKSAKGQLTFEGRTLDLTHGREEAFRFLKQRMIDQMSYGRGNLLDDLAQAAAVDPPNRPDQDRELMTWEQLAEVRQHDIAIGSHTHNHPILSRLTVEQQREELTVSKALITRRTGGPVRSIAYPTGGREHFNAETRRIAKEVGYELGFSFYSGYNRWSTTNAFDVRRTAVTEYDQIGLAGAVILPELLSWSG